MASDQMIAGKMRHLDDVGLLSVYEKTIINLVTGSGSMGAMVCGVGFGEGDLDSNAGCRIVLNCGCNHAESIKVGVINFAKMKPEMQKVLIVQLCYYSPSGGLPVRFDCDARDVSSVVIGDEEIQIEDLPQITIDSLRPWYEWSKKK
jgi:hypothetical protein